jgi:uncharacterized protein (TIGR02265 family)
VFDRPLTPSTSLTGTFDLEALVAGFPGDHLVKGMFCSRLVDVLGDDYEPLESKLIAPPRGGRYLTFKDYPAADYTRLVVRAAQKQFPELPLSESTRRLARDDIQTFASSTWGKVALTLVSDPRVALTSMPEAHTRAAPGPELRVEERDARTVRLIYVGYRGLVEYMLGQLEGVVLMFGRTPTVTIHRAGPDVLNFDVDHG